MISLKDFYNVLAQVIPLYVAMVLAYGSVKWWKIFSLDQCSGINRFVALFAVPLLSFHFISTNNPYEMNFRFIAADTLQKIIVLIFLFLWAKLSSRGSLEWSITLFSLSTLPNTLVMGIPLLAGMYGKDSSTLMVQIVVLQCIIWYTIMLFLFEFRGARMLISEQFPDDKAGLIKTFKVDSDVVSLHDKDNLETESQVGEDGKLHVRISRSTSSRSENLSKNSDLSHTPSNLSNVEIYSIPSKRFYENNNDGFYSFVHGSGKSYLNYNGSLKNQSNGNLRFFDEEKQIIGGGGGGDGGLPIFGSKRFARVNQGGVHGGYPAPSTTGIFSPVAGPSSTIVEEEKMGGGGGGGGGGRNDLHGFVRSSSASVFAKGLEVYKGNADYDHNGNGIPKGYDDNGKDGLLDAKPSGPSLEIEGPILSTCFARSTSKVRPESEAQCGPKPKAAPPAIAMTKLILIMIWRKLIRNPNTYSSVIGLAWSLISFRFHVQMPKIVANSISILSNTGLGMAMFSLGLFMALQPRIIAGGNAMAAYAAVVRFIIGPASMAATSAIVGLRGTLLQIAIVQAALPQGIVPFVFAKEYNVHPDILSTAVIFGMLIALPIALVYYILLGLIK